MENSNNEEDKNEREEFIQIDSIENRYPDGGWGWIVAIACSVTRACKQAIQPSFGLLFSGVLLKLGASSSTTAWIYNIYVLLEQFSKFVVGPLGDVIGWRIVVVSAGLMCFLNTLALMYISSVAYLIIFFSIGLGVPCGLSAYTSHLVVARYFNKQRGKATAIMFTGVCIGQICSPILVTFLLENFGYKGSILIISSIMLHICAAGLVMHPIEWHLKNPPAELHSIGHRKLSESIELIKSPERLKKCPDICYSITNIFQKFLNIFVAVLNAIKENVYSLRSYRTAIFALNVSTYITGYLNFHMMIPFQMQSKGHSFENAAVCISTIAIFGGISRIASPILSDWKKFNKMWAYIIGLAGLCIALFGFTLVSTLWWLLVVASFIGFFNGMIVSLYSLVMIDVLGMKLFKASYGLSGIFIGISSITLGPLIGMVRDISGNYDFSMRLTTGIVLISLILILLLPIVGKFDKT